MTIEQLQQHLTRLCNEGHGQREIITRNSLGKAQHSVGLFPYCGGLLFAPTNLGLIDNVLEKPA